jgi:hypothetical protein
MIYKFPLPLLGGYETILNEDRLIKWLTASINSAITVVHEIYEIPHTDYAPEGKLISEEDPAWEAIWNKEAVGIYELRTKYITTDWEYVNRYHIDVDQVVYGSTIHETYFIIFDDAIAVQFKLANHV